MEDFYLNATPSKRVAEYIISDLRNAFADWYFIHQCLDKLVRRAMRRGGGPASKLLDVHHQKRQFLHP